MASTPGQMDDLVRQLLRHLHVSGTDPSEFVHFLQGNTSTSAPTERATQQALASLASRAAAPARAVALFEQLRAKVVSSGDDTEAAEARANAAVSLMAAIGEDSGLVSLLRRSGTGGKTLGGVHSSSVGGSALPPRTPSMSMRTPRRPPGTGGGVRASALQAHGGASTLAGGLTPGTAMLMAKMQELGGNGSAGGVGSGTADAPMASPAPVQVPRKGAQG